MSRSGRPPAPLAAVAFDFDGVILESGSIKQQAFLDLFADHPELEPRILVHHRRHLGVSRYKKIDWIHRELLGHVLSPEELSAEGRRYSELVLDKVLSCPFVRGAKELLGNLDGRLLSFVVSATPQEELELIVSRRQLAGHFKEVWGSPGSKAEILGDLLRRHRFGADQMIMVGDGLSDYEAARQVGMPFILRRTAEQEDHFRGIEVESVNDLVELAPRLEKRLAADPARATLNRPLDRPGPVAVPTGPEEPTT